EGQKKIPKLREEKADPLAFDRVHLIRPDDMGPRFGGEVADPLRQLRKQGQWQQLAALSMKLDDRRLKALPAPPQPLVAREYYYQRKTNTDNVRRDFTETLYWHPVLVLPGGKQTDISFDLNDSATTFRVLVWGHALDGRLGAATREIASRLPFSLEP